MAEQVKLGRLLDETAQRDAVHVAIAPVVAGAKLFPGKGVGFEAGSTERVQHYGTTIGIVDPFLTEPVEPGQRCWMFLYPNTITSLRHDWTHPAFPSEVQRTFTDRDFSERWLRDYAKRVNYYDEDENTAFARLIEGLRSGKLFYHGSDLHGLWEVKEPDELRRHAEAYLGITIDWSRFSFSCSC